MRNKNIRSFSVVIQFYNQQSLCIIQHLREMQKTTKLTVEMIYQQ